MSDASGRRVVTFRLTHCSQFRQILTCMWLITSIARVFRPALS